MSRKSGVGPPSKQGYTPSSAVRWLTSEAVVERLGGLGPCVSESKPQTQTKTAINTSVPVLLAHHWTRDCVSLTGAVSSLSCGKKQIAFFDTEFHLYMSWLLRKPPCVRLPLAPPLCCDSALLPTQITAAASACDDWQAPLRRRRRPAHAAPCGVAMLARAGLRCCCPDSAAHDHEASVKAQIKIALFVDRSELWPLSCNCFAAPTVPFNEPSGICFPAPRPCALNESRGTREPRFP